MKTSTAACGCMQLPWQLRLAAALSTGRIISAECPALHRQDLMAHMHLVLPDMHTQRSVLHQNA